SNVLPLRLSAHASMTASELMGEAALQIRRGLDHQRYQFTALRRELGTEGRASYGASLNVMRFNYGFRLGGHPATAHNLSLGPVEELSIAVYDRADGSPLRIDFDANPALFSISELVEQQQRFLRLLEAMVDEPERAIGRLDILGAAERQTILRDWNDTAQAIPSATVPELFAAQAARTPDAVAVVFEQQLSYGELDARANQPAHRLRS